jgi:hypothetical protein
MSDALVTTSEYREWLKSIKQRLRQAQVKAAVQVNTALLTFYWELGADIVQRQKTAQWGSGFLKQLSADLMAEFPDVGGFSYRNIRAIRQWYLFYSGGIPDLATGRGQIVQRTTEQLEGPGEAMEAQQCVQQVIWPQAVAKLLHIPWGHNREILSKCKDVTEALYYVDKTIEHGWSRNVLLHQIESGLYAREGGDSPILRRGSNAPYSFSRTGATIDQRSVQL